MCTRMCPPAHKEAEEAPAARERTGRARARLREDGLDPIHEAYPGSKVPAYAAADAFSDPYARVVPDSKHSDYDERFFLIGMDLESRVLTV